MAEYVELAPAVLAVWSIFNSISTYIWSPADVTAVVGLATFNIVLATLLVSALVWVAVDICVKEPPEVSLPKLTVQY